MKSLLKLILVLVFAPVCLILFFMLIPLLLVFLLFFPALFSGGKWTTGWYRYTSSAGGTPPRRDADCDVECTVIDASSEEISEKTALPQDSSAESGFAKHEER